MVSFDSFVGEWEATDSRVSGASWGQTKGGEGNWLVKMVNTPFVDLAKAAAA